MDTPDELDALLQARRYALSGTARVVRESVNLSLSEIAGLVGRSPVTISRWERGQMPRGEAAVKWAILLDRLADHPERVAL